MNFLQRLGKYGKNILVAVDQLVNTLLLGDPDETISSRCGKRNCRVCRLLCAVLDRLDHRHCKRNIEEDEGANGI